MFEVLQNINMIINIVAVLVLGILGSLFLFVSILEHIETKRYYKLEHKRLHSGLILYINRKPYLTHEGSASFDGILEMAYGVCRPSCRYTISYAKGKGGASGEMYERSGTGITLVDMMEFTVTQENYKVTVSSSDAPLTC